MSGAAATSSGRPRQSPSGIQACHEGPNATRKVALGERSGEMRHSTISLESALAVVTLVWLFPVSSAIPAHDLHTLHEEGRRVPSTGGVELPSSHPSELLDCLSRHRYTPLACKQQNLTEVASSPPPPTPECGTGTAHGTVCFYGRGRCQYSATRGWYCRCGVPRQVARGVDRPAESFGDAAHCIDD